MVLRPEMTIRRAAAFCLALAVLPALAQTNENPTGDWLRANGTVRIAVSRCGNDYCVVNTWVKRPDGPEKAGDELVLSMRRDPAGDYRGTAYDMRRRLTYRMTVTLHGDQMKTRGCLLLGLICRQTGWKRIN
jgi:uncharacterized protein (DUF2147 family)